MALTELQLPTKTEFFANIQNVATNMRRLMDEWKAVADFIEDVATVDLDSIGVATGQVRTDLYEFRTTLNEMHNFFTHGSSRSRAPSAAPPPATSPPFSSLTSRTG